jgi:Na+/H+ antiporter NhaD/arsenite permease-like protein
MLAPDTLSDARVLAASLIFATTALFSNVVSNVPAVMLLRRLVPGCPDPEVGWLTLSTASTLAGNLTITGSAPTSSWSSGPRPTACRSVCGRTYGWACR